MAKFWAQSPLASRKLDVLDLGDEAVDVSVRTRQSTTLRYTGRRIKRRKERSLRRKAYPGQLCISTVYIVMPDAFEQVEHVGTTSLIGIGHNMAIRLKHNSTRITARTAKHSGNHPHKEQTFIGAKAHKFSPVKNQT
ncbi:hypothetical protein [Citrobacter werkmanii]|uniref:hypothetical protein n=1 Tax=Citrobacter werkmanii TaxID=67827 RepID=UPI0038901D0B